MARIKDRQFRFFEKVKQLTPDEAIVSSIMIMCQDSSIIRYYTNLEGDNSKLEMEEPGRTGKKNTGIQQLNVYILQQHELSSEKMYLQLHGKRLPPFYHHTMEIIEP